MLILYAFEKFMQNIHELLVIIRRNFPNIINSNPLIIAFLLILSANSKYITIGFKFVVIKQCYQLKNNNINFLFGQIYLIKIFQ